MRGDPRAGVRMDATAGDQRVHVNMVAHVPLPGMQRSHHADLSAQPPGIQGQGLQRLGGGPEEEIIDQLLMGAGEGIQAVGQGEGDQKVGNRQEFPELRIAPAVGAVLAALGAMAVAAGMVAVEKFPARVAIIHLAPQHLGAAGENVLDRLLMAGRHTLAILLEVGRAIFPHDVRQFQHERVCLRLERLRQALDRLTGLGVGNRGEMRVEGGGLHGLMAQIDLNLAQVHPGVEQMRGVGMAQGMHRRPFVDAGLLEGRSKGGLHATQRHRLRGGAGLIPGASGSREEPDRIVMGEPILSQQRPSGLGERDVAVLAPFAEPHVQQPAGFVDIRDLDMQGLFEAQAAAVNQRQTGSIAQQAHRRKQQVNLLHRQNHRQAFLFGRPDHIKHLPLALQGLFEEAFDAADRLGHTGPSPVAFVFDVQEVLAQFLFADVGGRFLDVVGQLAHGAGVGLLGARREPLELQILDEALPQIRRDVARSRRNRLPVSQAEGPPTALQELRVEEFEAADHE